MQTKQEIRRELLSRRDSLSENEVIEKSKCISQKIQNLPEFISAQRILTYIEKGSEVRTSPLIEHMISIGKDVILPITLREEKDLLLSKIENLQELEKTNLGILEPKIEFRRLVLPEEIELALVPGIAFDLRGYRLGYGGGYFDRLLRRIKAITIGLAFKIQIVDKLPRDQTDIPVNKIITEECIFICN